MLVRLIVTGVGILLIIFVNWYFLGPRKKIPSVPEDREKKKPE